MPRTYTAETNLVRSIFQSIVWKYPSWAKVLFQGPPVFPEAPQQEGEYRRDGKHGRTWNDKRGPILKSEEKVTATVEPNRYRIKPWRPTTSKICFRFYHSLFRAARSHRSSSTHLEISKDRATFRWTLNIQIIVVTSFKIHINTYNKIHINFRSCPIVFRFHTLR